MLQKIQLILTDPDLHCNVFAPPAPNPLPKEIYLCSEGHLTKGACRGDSGGPIYNEELKLQLGFTSFGGNVCGQSTPMVFVRISYYIDWITSITGTLVKTFPYSNHTKVTCELKPCLNSGRCLLQKSTYICQCAEGYSGPFCEVELSN
ncbi:alpha- and beta-fibrinogenase OhS1-like [Zophobas morio]|uniref:alpha- and beta-fibrinogenase OhS1-like n=1 Tax=Zophobas morio TaxID=2755281 RepID=UPI0030836125